MQPGSGWQLTWEVGWPRWRGGHRRGGCHQYACSFDLELAGRPDPSAVVWASPHPHHFAAARKEAVLCEAFPCARSSCSILPIRRACRCMCQRQWRVLHCYTFMASEAQGWHRLCREGGFGKLDEGRTQRHADAGEFYRKTGTRKASIPRCCHLSQRHEEMRESRCMSTYSQQTRTGHRACRRLEAVENWLITKPSRASF